MLTKENSATLYLSDTADRVNAYYKKKNDLFEYLIWK